MNDVDREQIAEFLLRLRSKRLTDPRLLDAVESVPRQLFLPPEAENPFLDEVWPIDCGETMPGAEAAVGLVAALSVETQHRVLEVGTGSGYVTALLGRLAAHVTSVERYARLVSGAATRLRQIGVVNVALLHADGREGFASGAPFDRILIHAALDGEPKHLLPQLATNGVVLAAVRQEGDTQMLVRFSKIGNRYERETLGEVFWQPIAIGRSAAL